jgi:hypothetical protein
MKKYEFFFTYLKLLRKGVGSADPDPLVRGADPRIRIRTKMSRIPKAKKQRPLFYCFPLNCLHLLPPFLACHAEKRKPKSAKREAAITAVLA